MGNAGFSKALGRRDVVSSERTCISSLLDSCLEGTRINLSSLNTKVEGYLSNIGGVASGMNV